MVQLQDLIGTACGLFNRGLSWHFFPTTLLSQADSAIGSKTSIDVGTSKNKVGLFYPPKSISAYPVFLKTLPIVEIISGLGDILHYLLPYHESIHILEDLISCPFDVDGFIALSRPMTALSLKVKSELIQEDEFDTHLRHVFNYGHTIGHALEKASSSYLPHGLAVLLGLKTILLISDHAYYSSPFVKKQILLLDKFLASCFASLNLSYTISLSKLINSLKLDKKNTVSGCVSLYTLPF